VGPADYLDEAGKTKYPPVARPPAVHSSARGAGASGLTAHRNAVPPPISCEARRRRLLL
jgi:hypothetical protein